MLVDPIGAAPILYHRWGWAPLPLVCVAVHQSPTISCSIENTYEKSESWETMFLKCPSCDNERSFQVKTLQMHVIHVDATQVDLADEGRPAVLELMCDECEEMVDLQDVDAELRKEIFLILGAG